MIKHSTFLLLILFMSVTLSLSCFAAEEKPTATDIMCTLGKLFPNQVPITVTIGIEKLMVNADKSAAITYTMALSTAEVSTNYAPYQTFQTTRTSAKNVANVPYAGKKYKNHLKFPLEQVNGDDYFKTDLSYDHANLIFSPAYKVVKSIKEHNNWNPNWSWTVEIRQHSAALDLSLDDHHGDYYALNCYSVGMVDEVRPK